MKFWVFTHSDQPLEHWLEGYQQRFDAWEEGGVEGIIVGRMQFKQDDGSLSPAIRSIPSSTLSTASSRRRRRPAI